jgi:GTP-binding protein
VVEFEDREPIVLADIPGLIEGAHAGVGLGSTFLRHIQRTRGLIHLVDGEADDPLADFSQTNNELALFDSGLRAKPQILAINKVDLPQVAARLPSLMAAFESIGQTPLAISGLARIGLDALISKAYDAIDRSVPVGKKEEVPVYRPESDPTSFEIQREKDGTWRVSGDAIERAAQMTYWEYDEAVRRFQRLLTRLGVEQALRGVGVGSGDTVRIGDHELEWRD